MTATNLDPRSWRDVAAEAEMRCDSLRYERDALQIENKELREEVDFWKKQLRNLASKFAEVICELDSLAMGENNADH